MSESLMRRPKLEDRTGLKKSMTHDLMDKGLMPKPIRIGERAVAWIESEVDAIVAARIAGKSDDEIRKLVKALTVNRQQLAYDILAAT